MTIVVQKYGGSSVADTSHIREIAERILSDEKQKWWTCKEFYFECDNLRDRYTNEKDEKKLKFLDEINEFVEGIQKKYEQA